MTAASGVAADGVVELSVAVAVHRSSATLAELVEQVRLALTSRGLTWELVLVDDASDDGTWERIVAASVEHPEVRGVRLGRNVGEDLASRTAIAATVGAIVVTLDDDLQHPPHELVRLAEAVTRGADLVYGVPNRLRHPPARRLGTVIWKRVLVVAVDLPGGIAPTSFRAMRGDLRGVLAADGRAIDPALARARLRTTAVVVAHAPRRHARSGYTAAALARHSWGHLTGYAGPLVRWLRRGGIAAAAVAVTSARRPGLAVPAGVAAALLGVAASSMRRATTRSTVPVAPPIVETTGAGHARS